MLPPEFELLASQACAKYCEQVASGQLQEPQRSTQAHMPALESSNLVASDSNEISCLETQLRSQKSEKRV